MTWADFLSELRRACIGVASRLHRSCVALYRSCVALYRSCVAPPLCKSLILFKKSGPSCSLPFFYLFFYQTLPVDNTRDGSEQTPRWGVEKRQWRASRFCLPPGVPPAPSRRSTAGGDAPRPPGEGLPSPRGG